MQLVIHYVIVTGQYQAIKYILSDVLILLTRQTIIIGAAKRFVKSSLWQAAKAKTKEDMPTKNQDAPIQIGK
jgi:hypothetical protein